MKKISLSRGKQAIVDNDDFEKLSKYNWYLNENAERTKVYAMRTRLKNDDKSLKGTKVYMHRIVMNVKLSHISVKHKNGNTLDNRKENLIVVKRIISKKK
jgi:hypothetical protein